MTVIRFAFIVAISLAALGETGQAKAEEQLSFTILEEQAHNNRSFTQGLFWQNGKLYESSGLYGKSFLHRYDAQSNLTEQHQALPRHYFAEGLTLFQNELYLLTWRAGKLLVFDPSSFKIKKQLSYQGEGWGLSHDGTHFLMSDGSENIHFRDNEHFKIVKSIQVHNKWRKYPKINELEFAEGAIWANVWQTPYILRISPEDGTVQGIASLQELTQKNSSIRNHSVLNGIAYDQQQKAFWVTGKLWPKRYLVKFHP